MFFSHCVECVDCVGSSWDLGRDSAGGDDLSLFGKIEPQPRGISKFLKKIIRLLRDLISIPTRISEILVCGL